MKKFLIEENGYYKIKMEVIALNEDGREERSKITEFYFGMDEQW